MRRSRVAPAVLVGALAVLVGAGVPGGTTTAAASAPARTAAARTLAAGASPTSPPTAPPTAPTTSVPTMPAMPARLRAGALTDPARSVPAYVSPGSVSARTRSGDGVADATYALRTPSGRGTVLWGDWWGRGAVTPALFRAGTWSFYPTLVGDPAPTVTAVFGTAGDRPVVGDWDGDGRTDLGVVRGTQWYLAPSVHLGPHAVAHPSSARRFALGRPGDQVVAGDWDGDGATGVGVRHDGAWWLRDDTTPSAPVRYLRVAGLSGNETPAGTGAAVVGDWDATGRDSVGVVSGGTWLLAARTRADAAVRSVHVVRPAGTVPAPWSTTGGPDGQSCPTARTGLRLQPALSTVVAAQVPVPTSGGTPDDPADGGVADAPDAAVTAPLHAALVDALRFLMGKQYAVRWSHEARRPYTDVRARDDDEELSIRRPAMAALATSIALATHSYAKAEIGRPASDAFAYVDWLTRSIACEHASITPGGWGWGVQTAHWATLTAESAWLVWDHVSPPTRAYVTAMIQSEADYQLSRRDEYYADAHGHVVRARVGNSAAEEEAWNALALELAHDMSPGSPHAASWRAKAVQLEVVAYSRPRDRDDDTLVNGVALSRRLAGSNILGDGSLVNHHRVHPDYMGNVQHLWWTADYATLSGGSVPEAAFHDADLVYGAFSTLRFTAGAPSAATGRPYLAPGGTIYRYASGAPRSLYFPDGSDWGVRRMAPFMSIDAHARLYGLDSRAAWPALAALQAHTRGQLDLVAASGTDDGRTYSIVGDRAGRQDRYGGREEYAAQQVATAWLADYLLRFPRPALDSTTYPVPRVLPDRGRFAASSSRRHEQVTGP